MAFKTYSAPINDKWKLACLAGAACETFEIELGREWLEVAEQSGVEVRLTHLSFFALCFHPCAQIAVSERGVCLQLASNNRQPPAAYYVF